MDIVEIMKMLDKLNKEELIELQKQMDEIVKKENFAPPSDDVFLAALGPCGK
jgi:hypothetical protein